ncbi:MAG TPA: hypothetical protein DCG12_22295, partial [Planctomycetaceae bacterium]|nr:hypothetical protein [Planctomycetaceae bacterium]
MNVCALCGNPAGQFTTQDHGVDSAGHVLRNSRWVATSQLRAPSGKGSATKYCMLLIRSHADQPPQVGHAAGVGQQTGS